VSQGESNTAPRLGLLGVMAGFAASALGALTVVTGLGLGVLLMLGLMAGFAVMMVLDTTLG
jgi:hypothetical protein